MSSPADSDDAFPHNYLSPSASYGMPGSTFLYASPLRSPEPFLFDLPIPSPKSRDLYSHLVWHASVVLADQVAAGEIEVAGKTVLELGCGLGLPGLVAARMGAKQVVLSDYADPRALADTRRTAEATLPPELLSRCDIVGHTFGDSVDPLFKFSSHFDVILVADCVWEPTLHAPLISTLRTLLDRCPHATVHFAAGFHTGRRTVAQFLARAQEQAIVPLPPEGWREVSFEGEERPWNWDGCAPEWTTRGGGGEGRQAWSDLSFPAPALSAEERQEERIRWTLYGTLGAGEV